MAAGRSGVRTKLDRSYPKLVRPKILVVHKLIVPNTSHYQKLIVQRRVVQRLVESKSGCTKDRSPQIQVVPKTARTKTARTKDCLFQRLIVRRLLVQRLLIAKTVRTKTVRTKTARSKDCSYKRLLVPKTARTKDCLFHRLIVSKTGFTKDRLCRKTVRTKYRSYKTDRTKHW